MKSEYKLFGLITAFLFGAAAVYAWWTVRDNGHVEWIGTVALILSGLLCGMCGGYFWFVFRRIDLRRDDRLVAEIADGAGEIGFFRPGSYYPFGLALAASVGGLGIVFWVPSLGAVGVAVVLT